MGSIYEYLPETTEYITWTNALHNRCYMCIQEHEINTLRVAGQCSLTIQTYTRLYTV